MADITFYRPPIPPHLLSNDNVTLQSHLLSLIKFGSLIQRKDTNIFWFLVQCSLSDNSNFPLIAGCKQYFKHIASMLNQVDCLFCIELEH